MQLPPKVTIAFHEGPSGERRCTLMLDGDVVAADATYEEALWQLWADCNARSNDWTAEQRQHVAEGLVEITHRIYGFAPDTEVTTEWDFEGMQNARSA